ncbi:DsbA family oxidoreductase [Alphaproteobacteria bacterium]|jgi:predicted DsbA family dithiol-disulfide isomerase|nr:DsbA family oxidoreductase [Alphaproteobacteria bacterium]
MRITIDVYSDPVCPWCFIGKRRLNRALKSRPNLTATVRWRAFQLNPTMPEHGMERDAYLVSRFGSTDEAKRLFEQIGAVGAREEIDFRFNNIEKTPNTVAAHSLIHFAAKFEKSELIVEALFRAFFLYGRDIGDTKQLHQIAIGCGLDGKEYTRFTQSDAASSEVQAEDILGRRIGIDGVPFFIINETYALSGTQEPEAFNNIFDMVAENKRNEKTVVNAAVSQQGDI